MSTAAARPRGRPRGLRWDGTYRVEGDVELSREQHDEAQRQIVQADQETAQEQETRVNFRWGKQQLAVVQRAARLAGVGYQAYLKEAAFRRALEDLRAAREAGIG